MKTTFRHIPLIYLLFALLSLPINGQEEVKNGFIRLANAICQGNGKVTMEIDGKNVNDEGYVLGDSTGGIKVPIGSRNVTITREGTESGNTKVSVLPNETTILIPFTEKVPASDTKPAYWAIRILRLKQRDPEQGKSATFVSVSQNPELKIEMREPDGKWNTYFVKRLTITKAPVLYPRGYVPLRCAEGDLDPFSIGSEGNYVVILYDDENSKLKTCTFKDRKFLSAD